MKQSVYEDYKYSMQDTSRVYVGCKYTFAELLEAEEVMFKFRMIVQKYIASEYDPEDTLETQLYYLKPEDFLVKLYRQMKARGEGQCDRREETSHRREEKGICDKAAHRGGTGEDDEGGQGGLRPCDPGAVGEQAGAVRAVAQEQSGL